MKHHEAIDEKDLQDLYDSDVFDITTPKGLFRKVFFEVMYYMYRSNRANLRTLKCDDFAVDADQSGHIYVYLKNEELTKWRYEDETQGTYENGRMYEIPGSWTCPVFSYKQYVSKLNPQCPLFFQHAKSHAGPDDPIWYTRGPLGINTIAEMMGHISEDAHLSRRYTNHCIKRTCFQAINSATKITPESIQEGDVNIDSNFIRKPPNKNCEKVTTFSVNAFRSYLQLKGLPLEFEEMSAQSLSEILETFYVEARKNNGEPYDRKILLRIRLGINRYLQDKGTGINILNNYLFANANAVFRSQNTSSKWKPVRIKQRKETTVNNLLVLVRFFASTKYM